MELLSYRQTAGLIIETMSGPSDAAASRRAVRDCGVDLTVAAAVEPPGIPH
jgi:hypothetical protein